MGEGADPDCGLPSPVSLTDLLENTLSLKVSSELHYHHGEKLGSMRAGMVLELRVLPFDRQLQEETVPHWATVGPASTVTCFLQQNHIHSKKDTPPNVASPYGQAFKYMSL